MNYLGSVDLEHGLCLDVVHVQAISYLCGKFIGLMMCDMLLILFLHLICILLCILSKYLNT